MTITKKKDGSSLIVAVVGRLDTSTTPGFEAELKPELNGVTELVLDFDGLDYISSAGLRALLSFQKQMNTQGSMKIKNVNDIVNEIFEVTGFSDILTVESK